MESGIRYAFTCTGSLRQEFVLRPLIETVRYVPKAKSGESFELFLVAEAGGYVEAVNVHKVFPWFVCSFAKHLSKNLDKKTGVDNFEQKIDNLIDLLAKRHAGWTTNSDLLYSEKTKLWNSVPSGNNKILACCIISLISADIHEQLIALSNCIRLLEKNPEKYKKSLEQVESLLLNCCRDKFKGHIKSYMT